MLDIVVLIHHSLHTIYIVDLQVLRVVFHIQYYKMISNALIKTVNRIAYLEKEETVEALMALLKEEI